MIAPTLLLHLLAGSLLIAAACLGWGIDNNVTRGLSAADPVQITMIKGLTAGAINVALALMTGARLPALSLQLIAAIVGFVGYGRSSGRCWRWRYSPERSPPASSSPDC